MGRGQQSPRALPGSRAAASLEVAVAAAVVVRVAVIASYPGALGAVACRHCCCWCLVAFGDIIAALCYPVVELLLAAVLPGNLYSPVAVLHACWRLAAFAVRSRFAGPPVSVRGPVVVVAPGNRLPINPPDF